MEPGAAGAPSAASRPQEERRPQAAPLPKKRGEIGYQEGTSEQEQSRSSSPEVVLPARHPADRDTEQGSAAGTPAGVQSSATGAGPGPSSSTSDTTSTIDSVSEAKRKGHLLGLFKCGGKNKPPPKIGGITSNTLFKFTLQVLTMSGTIVAWVFTTKLLQQMRFQDKKIPATSIIFMHVIFGIAILSQVFLLERRIFRMRAERYSHLHPGEFLPRFRNRETLPDDIISFSPWNRPPLPTYAAVLAQSGRGTGDVEDHVIAQQPPPTYGNTRGSTFLLSGFLNENLRLQRPASVHSASSIPDRPKSYQSRDIEWEVIRDADRAMRLEETLAILERSASHSSRT